MRVAKWSLLAVGVSLGTTGCAIATTVGADYDPTLDLGLYPNFAWDESAITRTDDVRLENNPFFEERLFEAVERALSERGISYNESSSDLLVHYHLSVMDHIEVVATNPQFGDPPSPYGEGTEVLQYDQGTFVLHFVDAATDEDLWVGWAQGDIGAALKDSLKMREWVEDAVEKMLKDFPVQAIRTGTRG